MWHVKKLQQILYLRKLLLLSKAYFLVEKNGSACVVTFWPGKNWHYFALEVFTKTECFHFIDEKLGVLWFEVISACGYLVPQMFSLHLFWKSVSPVWSFYIPELSLVFTCLLFLFKTTYEHGDCRTVQMISTFSSAHFGIFGITTHIPKSSSEKKSRVDNFLIFGDD